MLVLKVQGINSYNVANKKDMRKNDISTNRNQVYFGIKKLQTKLLVSL